jgi:hypothetical protein
MGKILKIARQPTSVAGVALVANLVVRAQKIGDGPADVAAALGVTVSYLSQLFGGLRDANLCSHQMLLACARYLELPPIYAYVLADVLTLEDVIGFDADAVGYMQQVAQEYSRRNGGKFSFDVFEPADEP